MYDGHFKKNLWLVCYHNAHDEMIAKCPWNINVGEEARVQKMIHTINELQEMVDIDNVEINI